MRAAGESTRLRLLALLAEGEHSVKDLTEILGQSQPRVSRHLKLLADAGLVDPQRRGRLGLLRPRRGRRRGRSRALADRAARSRRRRTAPATRRGSNAVRAAQQAQAAEYFAKVAESWDALRNLHVPEVGGRGRDRRGGRRRARSTCCSISAPAPAACSSCSTATTGARIGIDSEPRDDRGGARQARRRRRSATRRCGSATSPISIRRSGVPISSSSTRCCTISTIPAGCSAKCATVLKPGRRAADRRFRAARARVPAHPSCPSPPRPLGRADAGLGPRRQPRRSRPSKSFPTRRNARG